MSQGLTIIQLSPEELTCAIRQAVETALAKKSNGASDDLLTRKQTAEYLHVTLPTLNSWEKGGKIKPIRFGSRVFFKKSDLMRSS